MKGKRLAVLKHIWNNFERYLMVTLMLVFLINIFMQVFSRMLFNHPLSYTEELSRFSFLWMVLLGLSFATKYNRHIRVTILADKFPPTAKKVVDIFINLLACVLFGWLFFNGIRYVIYTAPTKTPSLQISRAYVASIVPLCSLLMVLRTAEKIVLDIKNFRKPLEEGGEKP